MTSAQPLKDAFGHRANLKRVLISLFGATAGQGVVWYTGQFYALFYLQTVLKVNAKIVEYHRGGGAAAGDAVFHGVWRDLRSHRAQVDHDGGVFAGDCDVHSDLQVDAETARRHIRWSAGSAARQLHKTGDKLHVRQGKRRDVKSPAIAGLSRNRPDLAQFETTRPLPSTAWSASAARPFRVTLFPPNRF